MLTPGLALSWTTDAKDKSKWTFKIREGAKFHVGSEFTAEAAVWNLDKLLNDKSPQYDPKQAAQGRTRIPSIASYRAINKTTLEVTTKEPDAFLPYQLSWIAMSSPAHWEKLGKLVLLPLPEANTRTAALRSGQVDWIEAPAPDTVASLKGAGYQIATNAYPHSWVWHYSMAEGSPFLDPKVHKAMNLAIDYEGLNKLLGGLSIPAKGFMPPGHAWFGKAPQLKFDPAAARTILAEAGYTSAKPLVLKVVIPSSGSGMMQPLPMNEYLQQNLGDVGVKVNFEVMEWNTLLAAWRAGSKDPASRGGVALNYSYFVQDPFTAFTRHFQSDLVSPKGTNWGHYASKEMDSMLSQARNTFDPKEQTIALQKLHEKIVGEDLFLTVTHDVNARAMSSKVKGFVQAQNWFQNFSSITMTK